MAGPPPHYRRVRAGLVARVPGRELVPQGDGSGLTPRADEGVRGAPRRGPPGGRDHFQRRSLREVGFY